MDKLPKDLDWMFKNYMEFFEKFGMNKQNISTVFFQWKMDSPGGVKEYLWDIFLKLLYEADQLENDVTKYRVKFQVYKEMWQYKVEVKGENGSEYYQKYLYCGLKLYQLYQQKTIRINSGKCCPYCNAFHDTHLPIEIAIQSQPLASANCTNTVCCNCLYIPSATTIGI
jgi:hypothetical protein